MISPASYFSCKKGNLFWIQNILSFLWFSLLMTAIVFAFMPDYYGDLGLWPFFCSIFFLIALSRFPHSLVIVTRLGMKRIIDLSEIQNAEITSIGMCACSARTYLSATTEIVQINTTYGPMFVSPENPAEFIAAVMECRNAFIASGGGPFVLGMGGVTVVQMPYQQAAPYQGGYQSSVPAGVVYGYPQPQQPSLPNYQPYPQSPPSQGYYTQAQQTGPDGYSRV